MADDEKLTVSISEAARKLGVSRNLAYAQARSGVLPTIRFGRRLLVPRAGLNHLIESGWLPDKQEGTKRDR